MLLCNQDKQYSLLIHNKVYKTYLGGSKKGKYKRGGKEHGNSKENKAGSGVHFSGYWYILYYLCTVCRLKKEALWPLVWWCLFRERNNDSPGAIRKR